MELTPFPSDFGRLANEQEMLEWDLLVPMDNLFSQMFTKVQEAYATLPDAPQGWKWDLVTQNDEPIYSRTDRELSLHFALVKEFNHAAADRLAEHARTHPIRGAQDQRKDARQDPPAAGPEPATLF